MCLRAVILPLGGPLGIFISMEGVGYYYVQKGLLIGYIFAFLNLRGDLRGYIFDFCSMLSQLPFPGTRILP